MPVILGEEVATELSAAKLAICNMTESARFTDQRLWMSWMLIQGLIDGSVLNPNRDAITARVREPEINRVQAVIREVLWEVGQLHPREQRRALVALINETVRCTAGTESQNLH